MLNVLIVSGKPKIFANSLGGEGGASGSEVDTTDDGEGEGEGAEGVGPLLTGLLEEGVDGVGEDGTFLPSEVMVITYRYFCMFICLIGSLTFISPCLQANQTLLVPLKTIPKLQMQLIPSYILYAKLMNNESSLLFIQRYHVRIFTNEFGLSLADKIWV